MPSTSSTRKGAAPAEAEPPPRPKRPSFLCCCGGMEDIVQEVQLQVKAANAPPPLLLEHGYANEENETRGMAPPKYGTLEVVNKNREGDIIAVLVAANAEELLVKGRDLNGYADSHLRLMPEQTVMHASFEEEVTQLQVALFYGCKYRTMEKAGSLGTPRLNFEFLKIYQISCRAKNVLLKYKKGDLEPQKGSGESMLSKVIGKTRSVGGGIDMKTNVEGLELIYSK